MNLSLSFSSVMTVHMQAYSTVFHPQGGCQPPDAGFITARSFGLNFTVEVVDRLKGRMLMPVPFFLNPCYGCRFLWISEYDDVKMV